MATANIIVPKYDPKSGRPKMVIQGSNGDAFALPWAPRAVEHTNWGEEVVEIDRPGRVPDVAVKNPRIRKMSFTFTLGRSITVSCEDDIKRLKAIVDAGGWIQILYGPQESGLWKCTDMSVSTVEREPERNAISRATVSMTFVEVPDSRKTVAKYSNDFNFRDDAVTAGIADSLVQLANTVRRGLPAGTTSGSGSGGTVMPQNQSTYVVKQGDTLLSIAQNFYGQYGEQFWRLVGDANLVSQGKLLVGQVLRIP